MTDLAHRRRRAALAVLPLLLVSLAACSGGSDEPEPASQSTATATEPPTAADPPAAPKQGACYRLGFQQALSPTVTTKPSDCREKHTSETYAVGRLDTVVDGHLLAVDSDRARAQVAEACPSALAGYVGGDPQSLRLSMIRPVWFTPTVAESDLGANWYRCDAVVVSGDDLLPLEASLKGALGRPADRERYAMCGTAAPDADAFTRVVCSADHSWRAIAVVPFDPGDYPGETTVRQAGQSPCEQAGLDAADDPLDYQWGYEWPTREQWDGGQTYGRCWAPD